MQVSHQAGQRLADIFFACVLTAVLLLPSKNFLLYHVGTASVLLVGMAVWPDRLKFAATEKILLALAIYLFAIGWWSAVWFGVDVVRNATESFRFVPLLLFFMLFSYRVPSFAILFRVMFLYTVAVFCVGFLQFIGSDVVEPVTGLYVSDLHREVSIGRNNRVAGLSPGPGQGALLMVLSFAFFLGTHIVGARSWQAVWGMALSLVSVLLTQSQSGFISILCVIIFVLLLFSISRLTRANVLQNRAQVLIFFGALFAVVYLLWDQLRYLGTLFVYGLNRSSYRAREEKWGEIMDYILGHPVFLVFGHGKDALGPVAGAVDNEYLFYFAVYGLLVTLLLVGVLLSFVLRPIWSRAGRKNHYAVILSVVTVGGMVLAWPTTFLTDPRALLFMGMLFVLMNDPRNATSQQDRSSDDMPVGRTPQSSS